MAQTELKAVITAEDKASPTLRKFGASVGDIAKGVAVGQLAVQGLNAAFGAIKGVISSSIASYNESAKVTAQLDAVLKSTKGSAGLAKTELLSLASSLEKTTTFSDEAILSAQNMLLTFTKIGKEVFPQATETILNMSTALGQDTKSSAIQLGKALNDPIEGITALRRVGVSFNEQQREQIETMVKAGNTMGAQKLILQELATEFGGSASAQAETFQGKMQQMANQIDNMKERIGEAILKGIAPFAQRLSEFISSPAGQKFMDGVTASLERFFTFISNNKDLIFAFFQGLGIIFKSLAALISNLIGVFRDLTGALSNILFKIGEVANKAKNVPIVGGLFGKIAGFLGFAEGGVFNAGQPMIVGEKGPEVIMPRTGGEVIPNHKLGGDTNINVSFGNVSMSNDMDVENIGRILARQIQLMKQGA